MRLSEKQQNQIVKFLRDSDPWEATPAVNFLLNLLGYEDTLEFVPDLENLGERDKYLWS